MVDAECEYCFMEVSSHALHQERVADLSFDGGVFTNITNDHLDYHTTFSEYRDVKKSFFDSLSAETFALVNKDDKNSTKMLETTKAKKITYALKSMADFNCKVIEGHFDGMLLMINNFSVWVKLIGDFNAYNLLSVYAVAKLYRFSDSDILTALSMLDSAEGRLQFLKNQNSIIGIVDYAHTEDALKNALITIKNLKTNSQKLVTIIGCGGNRDKSKRPFMTKVACEYSSVVILTSDNPRFEDPDLIISDMLSDLNANQKEKVLSINNRKQAIMTAGKLVTKDDIIFLAGKGHEKYQEIKGKKLPFDDVIELKKSLNII
jgi:UDP-N-acetylmuramoyl-L-alanyl-D-glutamate--2,6-diaminopimelate ligase